MAQLESDQPYFNVFDSKIIIGMMLLGWILHLATTSSHADCMVATNIQSYNRTPLLVVWNQESHNCCSGFITLLTQENQPLAQRNHVYMSIECAVLHTFSSLNHPI